MPACAIRGDWPAFWPCPPICPCPDTLAAEASPANRDVPIFMAHGNADPVIPQDFSRRSADLLSAAGYPLAWHSYRMEHSLCLEELRDIEPWLAGVLVA